MDASIHPVPDPDQDLTKAGTKAIPSTVATLDVDTPEALEWNVAFQLAGFQQVWPAGEYGGVLSCMLSPVVLPRTTGGDKSTQGMPTQSVQELADGIDASTGMGVDWCIIQDAKNASFLFAVVNAVHAIPSTSSSHRTQ